MDALFEDLHRFWLDAVGARAYRAIWRRSASGSWATREFGVQKAPVAVISESMDLLLRDWKQPKPIWLGGNGLPGEREVLEPLRRLAGSEEGCCFPILAGVDLHGLVWLVFGPRESKPDALTHQAVLATLRCVGELVKERARRAQQDLIGLMPAGLAHDLQNLMTPLLTLVQLVEAEAARMPDNVSELVPVALRNLRMLESIVRISLLGGHEEPFEILELQEPVADAAELVNAAASEKSVKVAIDIIRRQPVLIRGNRLLIVRLLVNLLSNAINASSAGGTVRVELTQEEGKAKISVADEGKGFSEERFRESDEGGYAGEGKRSDGELGLGLAICRAIAARHGGRLVLERNPQGGVTAITSFPSA